MSRGVRRLREAPDREGDVPRGAGAGAPGARGGCPPLSSPSRRPSPRGEEGLGLDARGDWARVRGRDGSGFGCPSLGCGGGAFGF